MQHTSKIIRLCACLLWLGFPAQAMQTDLPNINVLADPSLSAPISRIARQFSDRHGISVTTAFAPAKSQSENITGGMEADVFITSDKSLLDDLQKQGLLDVYSKKTVSRNRISFVTYADNPLEMILIPKLPLATILGRLNPQFSFIIGDPNFQNAGRYGLKALRNYEMIDGLEPHMLFVRSGIDVQRTIAEPGGYGVMYTSEAKRNPALKVLGTFPEVAHSPIEYVGMVVAGEQMETARRFLEYLSGVEAQLIFEELGFESIQNYSSESGHLARGSAVSRSVNPL